MPFTFYRLQQAAVKMPYTIIGITLLLLAVLISFLKLPKVDTIAAGSSLASNVALCMIHKGG